MAGLRSPVREAVRIASITGLMLLIVVPPQSFIRCQMEFYQSASDIVRNMATTAETVPSGNDLTFVNLPFFFSSDAGHPDGCPSPYPWTPVGAVVAPPYAQARDFVRFNGGPDRPVTAVSYDGYNAGWRTVGDSVSTGEMRRLAETGRVQVFDLIGGSFVDLNAHWQTAQTVEMPAVASFGESMNLVDAAVESDPTGVTVGLQWQIAEPPPSPLAVFVHLYGPDGALIAQADAPPGGGFVPVTLWRTGDRLSDTYRLDVDVAALPPGSYSVRTGVYDPGTGVRLTATENGQPVPDDAVEIGRIDIES